MRERRGACSPGAEASKHGGSVIPVRVSRDADLKHGTEVAKGDDSNCL